MKSFIYQDMTPLRAEKAGYFKPSEEWNPLADVNYVQSFNKDHKITKDTLIAYYPGAFGHFHKGHKKVVSLIKRQLEKITDDYAIVIAPANSEYNSFKYGAYSHNALNKSRFDRMLLWQDAFEARNVYIDLNPMLNHRVDQNFTDLLKDFVDRNVPEGYFGLKHTPVIVCGKDRNFDELNKCGDLIRSVYIPMTHDISTSTHFLNYKFLKKKLLLRCYTYKQFNLFCNYFAQYFSEIIYSPIEDERHTVKNYADHNYITICKDYKDILQYFKLSRKYDHPLSDPYFTDEQFEELLEFKDKNSYSIFIFDSDVFSGGTEAALKSRGFCLEYFYNLKHKTKTHELLDYDDFLDVRFKYPYYDMSSKCSLPAFTIKEHKLIEEFNNIANLEGL